MNNKEEAEGRRIAVFAKLLNQKIDADYEIGPVVKQNSIIDRELISVSGKYETLVVQLKDVIDLDTSAFKQSIMGDTKVFDSNIFTLLTPALKKIEEKYGGSAEDVVLVLSVGVSENWVRDYEIPPALANSSFKGIYCLGLPSSDCPEGYIFPFKEII